MNVIYTRPSAPTQPTAIRAAAQALGLDTFTLCALIQRDRIDYVFGDAGEILIAAEDIAKLTARKETP